MKPENVKYYQPLNEGVENFMIFAEVPIALLDVPLPKSIPYGIKSRPWEESSFKTLREYTYWYLESINGTKALVQLDCDKDTGSGGLSGPLSEEDLDKLKTIVQNPNSLLSLSEMWDILTGSGDYDGVY